VELTPTLFETVERVWKKSVELAQADFKSKQAIQNELPADSPWKGNNGVPGNLK